MEKKKIEVLNTGVEKEQFDDSCCKRNQTEN